MEQRGNRREQNQVAHRLSDAQPPVALDTVIVAAPGGGESARIQPSQTQTRGVGGGGWPWPAAAAAAAQSTALPSLLIDRRLPSTTACILQAAHDDGPLAQTALCSRTLTTRARVDTQSGSAQPWQWPMCFSPRRSEAMRQPWIGSLHRPITTVRLGGRTAARARREPSRVGALGAPAASCSWFSEEARHFVMYERWRERAESLALCHCSVCGHCGRLRVENAPKTSRSHFEEGSAPEELSRKFLGQTATAGVALYRLLRDRHRSQLLKPIKPQRLLRSASLNTSLTTHSLLANSTEMPNLATLTTTTAFPTATGTYPASFFRRAVEPTPDIARSATTPGRA